MALKDVITSIVAELIANGTLIDPTVHLGTSSKAQKVAPPAIFWAPKRGTGSGPLVAMSKAVQDAYYAANPGKSIPRALHSRAVEVEVHIWGGDHSSGDDFSATEKLLDATLSAIHHQAYGCYRYIGEEWVTTGTDILTLGRRCILSVEIFIPVLETAPVTADAFKAATITIKNQMGPIPPGGSTIDNP